MSGFTFTPSERLVLRAPERLTVSQWAARYRKVTTGSRPGPWRNDATPYLVGPMDALARSEVREVVCCFSPQSGKTQVAMNFIGWAACEEPDIMMIVLPDEKSALTYMKRRLVPMFRSSPRLARLLSPSSYDATRYRMTLVNGMEIFVAWAGSAAELASESARYVLFDETDKYPEFSGRESDPMSLARARQTTFPHTKKTVTISTPTTPEGNIWACLEKEADVVHDFHAVCPKCGAEQALVFDQVKWPQEIRDPRVMRLERPARYECAHCQAHWTDFQRNKAVSAGTWRARNDVPGAQVLGYHLPAMCSPFVSLSETAAAFLAGLNDPAKKMFFITNHLTEPWRATIKPVEVEALEARRCDLPAGHVPYDAIALTLAADMQLRGFFYTVFAHAPDRGPEAPRRSWMIEHGQLGSWDDLKHMAIEARWPILAEDGQVSTATMGIWRAALDTGGGQGVEGEWSRTEEAYLWLRNMAASHPSRVTGIKGASHRQSARVKRSQVDKLPGSNRPLPGGLVLFIVDTVSLKDTLFWRLSDESTQPVFFHQGTDADFFEQLTAEQKTKDRRGVEKWTQVRKANHFLDCCMMTMAVIDSSWFPSLERLPGKVNVVDQAASKVATKLRQNNPYTEGTNPFSQAGRQLPSWFKNRGGGR